jgi:RNA polymerase sigma factor (sigma-70 family)
MLLSPVEAEDAAQECLLRVATRLAQFEGGSRFSTWAWKVAVNRIIEIKRKPFFTAEQFAADLADGLDEVGGHGLRAADRERFERTFARHRTVILETAKHFIQEDEPAREAAEIRTFLREPHAAR